VLHNALRQRILEHGLQRRIVVVVAVERVRVSGAALVDEDNVARVVQPGEKRQHLRGERDRALSRTAGEHDDGIGFARAQPCGITAMSSRMPAAAPRSSHTSRPPQRAATSTPGSRQVSSTTVARGVRE
jgi:hypothetical protein